MIESNDHPWATVASAHFRRFIVIPIGNFLGVTAIVLAVAFVFATLVIAGIARGLGMHRLASRLFEFVDISRKGA
jgi:hypothetical protein